MITMITFIMFYGKSSEQEKLLCSWMKEIAVLLNYVIPPSEFVDMPFLYVSTDLWRSFVTIFFKYGEA